MAHLIHRTPSVGSIVTKIMAINPELGTQEMIQIIRQATRPKGKDAGDYASMEVVDENLALELARGTLTRGTLPRKTLNP